MSMTSEEIVALSKKHTIFEWTAQKNVAPIAVARAEGVYFWTPEGKRFIDFNSQLMSVNIGHGDRRVIEAIHEQAALVTYVAPSFSTEPRARLGAKLAGIAPGDIDVFFFTNGGAEANETAFKIARRTLAVRRSSRSIVRIMAAPPVRWRQRESREDGYSRPFPASSMYSVRTMAFREDRIPPMTRCGISKR